MLKRKNQNSHNYVWVVLAEYLHDPTHISLITRSEDKADSFVDKQLLRQRAKFPDVAPNDIYPKYTIHGLSEECAYALRNPTFPVIL